MSGLPKGIKEKRSIFMLMSDSALTIFSREKLLFFEIEAEKMEKLRR